jgi:hypothetical protein
MKKIITSALLVCMVANVASVYAVDAGTPVVTSVTTTVPSTSAAPAVSAAAVKTGILHWIKANKGKSIVLALSAATLAYLVYKVVQEINNAEDEEAAKAFEARLLREYAEQTRGYETLA